MQQQRLVVGALEAFTLSAHWVPASGWVVHVHQRRQFVTWEEGQHDRYECLSSGELPDVVLAALEAALSQQ